MFVNLTTGVNREDIDHFSFAIYGEKDAPAADARLPDSVPVGERCRQTRIERVRCKMHQTATNTLFGRPVEASRIFSAS